MTAGANVADIGRRPLSAVLIAFNEAHRIAACLESLAWADEIVVVDSGSSDGTQEIARRYTDQVFQVAWRGFGPQKQAAVELARHDMILNVDCDERVTAELSGEILGILAGREVAAGYDVPRRTFLGTKEIRRCGWYPDRTVRLFDRRRAHYGSELVHERVVVDGEIGRLSGHLLHYSFAGLSDLMVKMNRYTDLAARQMAEKGKKASLFDLTIRPGAAFLKPYVLKLGFLDGVDGFEVSVTNAMSTFAKYLKLREINQAASAVLPDQPPPAGEPGAACK
jgi:glycosyltransferase involved in cell wall biosynthesis